MEEPIFIKCEPTWPLDAEEQPSDFEHNIQPSLDNQVKIKEDPCSAAADPCLEEVVVKEPCSDQDEMERRHNEECDNSGGSSYELHSSSFSTTTLNVATLSDDSKMKAIKSTVDEVTWNCCSCGKSFQMEDHLKKHTAHNMIHQFSSTCCSKDEDCPLLGRGPYSCEKCNKMFTERKNLKQHMLIHIGDKPYSCSVCGKAFILKGSLKKHSVAHASDRPFSCKKCGSTFSRSAALKVHMLVHNRPSVYSCAKCGKKFRYLSSLNRHSQQSSSLNCYDLNYSEQKSLTCPVCYKTFSHLAACKSHMLIHSKRLHACKTCGKEFYQLSKLNTHRIKHIEKSSKASSDTKILKQLLER